MWPDKATVFSGPKKGMKRKTRCAKRKSIGPEHMEKNASKAKVEEGFLAEEIEDLVGQILGMTLGGGGKNGKQAEHFWENYEAEEGLRGS